MASNAPADRILRQADGLRLRNNKLVFQRPENSREVEAYVRGVQARAAAKTADSQLLLMRRVERPSGRSPYFLAGMAFNSPEAHEGALLLVEDLATHPPLNPDVCRTIYGFTPAETRVAMRHIAGRSQSQLMSALCRLAFLPIGDSATTLDPSSSG